MEKMTSKMSKEMTKNPAQTSSKSFKIYFWQPWFPPKTYFNAIKKVFIINIENVVRDVEQKLEKYLDSKHVILLPSGTSAIFAALNILLPKDTGEVLLPSLVCETVPYAVRAAGKKPCFLEIDPQTFNIDDNLIEDKINDKIEAIIAVHQFGMPCNMEKISQIAKENNLLLIEDAAQALGAEYNGKKAGTLGDVGILSFNNKVIYACGGGAVVTDNEDFFHRIRQYRDSHFALRRRGFLKHLLKAWVVSEHPKMTFAISKIISKIHHQQYVPTIDNSINLIIPTLLQSISPSIDYIVHKRRDNFKLYDNYLESKNMQKPVYNKEGACTFYSVKFKGAESDRMDKIQKKLQEKGIRAVNMASSTHHLFDPRTNLPITDDVSQTLLSFPTGPHLSENEIKYMSNMMNDIIHKENKLNEEQ